MGEYLLGNTERLEVGLKAPQRTEVLTALPALGRHRHYLTFLYIIGSLLGIMPGTQVTGISILRANNDRHAWGDLVGYRPRAGTPKSCSLPTCLLENSSSSILH